MRFGLAQICKEEVSFSSVTKRQTKSPATLSIKLQTSYPPTVQGLINNSSHQSLYGSISIGLARESKPSTLAWGRTVAQESTEHGTHTLFNPHRMEIGNSS